MQMEALKRYRTGGEQKVTVQHVTVVEGGQAIVGNVTQSAREAAPGSAELRPDAPVRPGVDGRANDSDAGRIRVGVGTDRCEGKKARCQAIIPVIRGRC
jgi:hypothetical protein